MICVVTVYSKDNCAYCIMVKLHLKRLGVPFEDRRVDLYPEFKEEVKKLGFRSVPVTIVDGQEPIVGYDAVALDCALKMTGYIS